MAKFKCKQTGNIYEFNLEHDIRTMQTHPDYMEVQEALQNVGDNEEVPTKRIGRPPKAKEE